MSGPTLREIPGVRVGHATDSVARTGCTVVLVTDGAVAGMDVRGSAPGTREASLLTPTALVEQIHAIVLAGGSAFGLAAADGVMRWLAERDIGFETPARRVPIVPAAVLYDLGVGDPLAAPTPEMGYAACDAAVAGEGPLEGPVGAGTGATVGKLGGIEGAVPSGIGAAGRMAGDHRVAALAAVNAIGNLIGPDGRLVAGSAVEVPDPSPGNTTLGVLATDAPLDRAQCRKLAELGHDALALAISPVHTMFDGDVVFALSTAPPRADRMGPAEFTRLGMAAVDALREAILRSVERPEN